MEVEARRQVEQRLKDSEGRLTQEMNARQQMTSNTQHSSKRIDELERQVRIDLTDLTSSPPADCPYGVRLFYLMSAIDKFIFIEMFSIKKQAL